MIWGCLCSCEVELRCLVGLFLGFACMEQWGRSDILAQARISEARLRFCLERSPRRPVHVLSDALSRSGEEVSLERKFVKTPCCMSRLGESPLFE